MSVNVCNQKLLSHCLLFELILKCKTISFPKHQTNSSACSSQMFQLHLDFCCCFCCCKAAAISCSDNQINFGGVLPLKKIIISWWRIFKRNPHPGDEYPHGDDEKPQKPMWGTLVSLADVGHPVHGGCVRVVLDKCIKKDIFSHPIWWISTSSSV